MGQQVLAISVTQKDFIPIEKSSSKSPCQQEEQQWQLRAMDLCLEQTRRKEMEAGASFHSRLPFFY